MANVLVLGSGAREHAIAWKLKRSNQVATVYVYPGNGAPFQKPKGISSNNVHEILSFCKNESINLVVVGPEDLLYGGIVDDLSKHNISCFGPSKIASRLEVLLNSSKMFHTLCDTQCI
ncbi:unnamed protein product [Anisakis simplex]|uniref:GARS_N domain-containing protein n=1 Tax=Anisakis simplex TaxID=6269 RepID=A0A0M3J5Y4_ANISI|nr:unnamed protein product [Anisakis simplex]